MSGKDLGLVMAQVSGLGLNIERVSISRSVSYLKGPMMLRTNLELEVNLKSLFSLGH